MHSTNFTALSRLVAVLLPLLLLLVVTVLLPLLLVLVPVLPFSADPFEQPAPIRATMARAASDRSLLLMFLPACDDCVDTSSYAERAGHCCILGSCVGSAYTGGQP